MITIDNIRIKIADAIKRSGKQQKEIAQALGIKQSQISCYVHGKKLPALDTFAKLCAVLDEDANEILCVDQY